MQLITFLGIGKAIDFLQKLMCESLFLSKGEILFIKAKTVEENWVECNFIGCRLK